LARTADAWLPGRRDVTGRGLAGPRRASDYSLTKGGTPGIAARAFYTAFGFRPVDGDPRGRMYLRIDEALTALAANQADKTRLGLAAR